MRTKGLALHEAAAEIGVSLVQALLWEVHDKDFGTAVRTLQLVRAIDFILKCDDWVREGLALTDEHKECVELAKWMIKQLEPLVAPSHESPLHRIDATYTPPKGQKAAYWPFAMK